MLPTAPEYDSPVEFVVVGPVAGRDAVLAKSRGAGIDLIGLSFEPLGFPYSRARSDLLSSLFPQSRQIHSVRVSSISDLSPSSDERMSDLVFAWAGLASELGVKRVLMSFQLQSREIAKLASEGNQAALEVALAPVILTCSQANERRSRFRRLLVAVTVMYIALGILGLGFVSLAYLLERAFPKY
jgi:hypothetical protein